jgi:flavin-dependent dehydrogenase
MAATTVRADVVVVGAGPAGSIAAAILAHRGWDVLLADRAAFPRDKACEDGLTPRAISVLDRLGLLSTLRAGGHQVVGGARLFAPNGTEWRLRFADYDLGLPPLGLVVTRSELDHLLCQHAVARGARFLAGFRVTGPIHCGKAVTGVRGTTCGQLVSALAPLTILATGANIGLLRASGLLQTMPPGINAIRGYFTGVPDLSDEFELYFDATLAHSYG